MRLNAMDRIRMVLDENTFTEYDADMISVDPLGFPGYASKLEQQTLKSGLREAVTTGDGLIHGLPAVVAVMSFDFFTGSMGSVVGEKITRAIEQAIDKRLPLIIFSTSGGARMQESILSLMQMVKQVRLSLVWTSRDCSIFPLSPIRLQVEYPPALLRLEILTSRSRGQYSVLPDVS